ncbi:MAG: hypothetical protein OXI40_14525 [Chloroflexota bacterium]|nr:hypothetical protein [Chloroflexota bacterium]
MVYALEETRRVLREGGSIIDLRPASKHRSVELEIAGARLHIGEIDSSATFADRWAAEAALDILMKKGQIALMHEAEFPVITDLDSVEDLRAHAAAMRRNVMAEELPERIEALIAGEAQDILIHARREMVIRRYRCLKP